ncbi:MAG: Gfo/Idh/MocA family oxidoreductase [Anaerolineales bacterium]|nr:Gfo/Idh/MocA family oxidoreductase [Anaerolineales bacterium]
MNKQDVRVGVIGVGRMGQRHCRVFANLRRAEFVGVYDARPEAAQAIATQHEVRSFNDLDALLDEVDAVSIAAPTPLHFELALRCIRAGVHVLIEKPITQTVAEAETLVAEAQRQRAADGSPLVVMLGHIERFNTAYIELKNVLEGMTPLAVNFRRLSAIGSSNTDVDVVLDLMIHDLNLALDLVGAPASFDASGLAALTQTLDHVTAQLHYPGGPLVGLTASRVTENKVRAIEVTAREAYLECNLLDKSILVHRHTIGEYLNHNHRGVKYRQESIVERIQVPIFESLFLELQHFLDSIIDGQLPKTSAVDGLETLRLTEAIRSRAMDYLARSHAPAAV